MAENGYGPAVPGYIGRIPNFGKTQVHPMGAVEPPACIQNAMMTKDKKPFTYTPGGLDLSQIKCPSQARRMARQRSLEEHEQAYGHHQNGGSYHPQGGANPPPPPPPQVPAPPPPPPLVISVPNSKSPNPKPVPHGERPEIVIPENPIGMLRKTNSPYHWEAEKADMERLGPVPKFLEKAPSPQSVQMPPSNFSQQPPQMYRMPNNQHPTSNYANNTPSSPIHKPEPQYGNQRFATPPGSSPPIREALQRQDSQFNKSPQPFSGQSPFSGSPSQSATPNSWSQTGQVEMPNDNYKTNPHSTPQFNRKAFSPNVQQREKIDSPANNFQTSPQTPPHYIQNANSPNIQQKSSAYNSPSNHKSPSPNVAPTYHTLPRAASKPQDTYSNFATNNGNVIHNNVNQARPQSPHVDTSSQYTPWRNPALPQSKDSVPLSTLYHNSQPNNPQPSYTPPWQRQQNINSQQEQKTYGTQWNQNNGNAPVPQQSLTTKQDFNNNTIQNPVTTPWRQSQDNRGPVSPPTKQNQTQEPRYQSTMTIPVTPNKRSEQENNKNSPQKEIVYVTQEPYYYCPGSPKTVPAWVKTQKEKTKTPPPEWCQIKLEGRKSLPRELVTPPRENNAEPEWVKKSNEMQRGIREVLSPPRYQQPQPTWSTKPSENRKSIPKDEQVQNGSHVIPIQVESNSNGRQAPPQLRVNINLHTQDAAPQGPYTQPTQRIMRVLSPQLVRFDDGTNQTDLPSLSRNVANIQNHSEAPKTRIIPIQIEGGENEGPKKRVYYHKFTQEGPPRQSKAFRVLQVITGTEDHDNLRNLESRHDFTDL